MISFRPQFLNLRDPFQIAMNMAYFHGGDPITTY